jgi:lysophospholipase L1-like esterase
MRRLLSVLCLFVVAPLGAEEKPFFFKQGDKVLFLGDSITEQYQYSTYMELYLTTRFPGWNLKFVNAGIGGDTANGGAGRFQSHVLNEKPTAVTINFGMNDGGYGTFNPQSNKVYVEKTTAMVTAAKKAGVRVALISPNAVDRRVNDRFKQYLETQKEFYAPLKGIAESQGVPFVDQYAVTRKVLEKLETDGATKVNPFPDGVHTSPSGGLLMAHTILVGLNAPASVSEAAIDATIKKGDGQKCVIENLNVSDSAVSFTRTDESLPMPVQKDWVTILPYINNLNDLNHYGLQVKGLTQGTWVVLIDGQEVAKVTEEQLGAGINLGNATTGPIYEKGQKVLQAINAKNQILHGRFRGVVMFNVPDWMADVGNERKAAELQKRWSQIEAKQAEIYELLKPQAWKFELKKQ